MPPLSVDTTAIALWTDAVRDLKLDPNTLYAERLLLVDRAVKTVVTLFADILSQSYMDEATPTYAAAGRYSTASGSWAPTTMLLTIVMDTDFLVADIGKTIVFRVGTSTYVGYVTAIGSITSVTLAGANLPTTAQTVDYAILLGQQVNSDSLDISTLRIMRTGPQVKCVLESTATASVRNMSVEEHRTWATTAFQNRNSIAWALAGSKLLLKKGSSVSAYGTLTFRYPRVPSLATANTTKVDVPDGATMELVTLQLKKIVAERINVPIRQLIPEYEQQVATYVAALYRTFGDEIAMEVVKDKTKALV